MVVAELVGGPESLANVGFTCLLLSMAFVITTGRRFAGGASMVVSGAASSLSEQVEGVERKRHILYYFEESYCFRSDGKAKL